MVVFEEVVGGWWEYQRLLRGSHDERRALEAGHPARVCSTWNEVHVRINAGGVAALELVAALLVGASNDEDVMLVGEGPVEDLVHKHGNALVGEIERLASRSPRFERALSCVWLAHGVVAPPVEERLSRWVYVSGAAKHRYP